MENNSNVVAASEAFAQSAEQGLIKAVQQGDKKAYQQLYQQYISQVYALCLRLTADKGLAEDASQEVFIQLWQKMGNFQGQSKFSTWLHTVTSNITITYLRKQRSWAQRMFNIETSVASEYAADQATDLSDLEQHILRLPERARIVFVLHAIEGYRHEEIAKMTGMALGSSKAQFHRAKGLLKGFMGYE